HAEQYVDGNVHTNRMENFWSLLKRAIKGTYVSVEPFHLFRYLDEQSFRYNERKATDAQRFEKVLGCVGGKRLTYAQVRGWQCPTTKKTRQRKAQNHQSQRSRLNIGGLRRC